MDKFQMIIEAAIAKAKSDANIKKYVKEIQGNIKDLEIDIKVSDGNVKSAIKQVNKDLKDTAKLSQNAFKLDEGKVQTFNRIGSYISNNTKLTKDQVVRLEELRNAISNVNDKSGLDQIKTKFRTVTSEAQLLGTVGDSTFTRLGKNVKQFMSFMGAATITMTAINTVRGMVNEVKNLDDSLVELRKVSDLTGNSLDRFVDKAYNMGAEVARTGKEVIDATTVFKRAGYTLEQSLDMAKASLVMVNVGDGIRNVEEASSALIATLKGFKLKDTDAMSVIDMINETSNNAAIDFDNITEGLRRVSGTLSQTGTSIQQTIGLLTGGFGSLRDIEMVSSGLLMISQRKTLSNNAKLFRVASYVQKCA